ncbi:MAG: hypothetical protein UY18_C0003G0023 [Microgenomates group bacterium GW2011_GWF2_47_9]|nr:MAG: hypothetical protein UY18_C0003G0023 [Microgenomates group bacterium GW2011_GWF2_47_9]
MAKKRKTKVEKIESQYRLSHFKLDEANQREKKVQDEFAYLSRDYVGKDLLRTTIFSVFIIGLLLLAKKYLG